MNGLLFVGNQAAEATMGTGWSTAMDQESQQQQFGWDTLNKAQQCCSLVEVKDQREMKHWGTQMQLARPTVTESFPESWNIGKNTSWLLVGKRQSWDKRDT